MLDNAALKEKDNDDFPVNDHTDNADTDTDNDAADNEITAMLRPPTTMLTKSRNSTESEADAMGDYFSADTTCPTICDEAKTRDPNELQYWAAHGYYEELQNQIANTDLNEHEREVMEYLIGCFGARRAFLRKDLESLTTNWLFSRTY